MMRRMGRPGLVGTVARTAVIAGTATAVAGGVRNHQEQKAMAAHRPRPAPQAPPPPPAPAAAPAADVDITGELTKLAEMHRDGSSPTRSSPRPKPNCSPEPPRAGRLGRLHAGSATTPRDAARGIVLSFASSYCRTAQTSKVTIPRMLVPAARSS